MRRSEALSSAKVAIPIYAASGRRGEYGLADMADATRGVAVDMDGDAVALGLAARRPRPSASRRPRSTGCRDRRERDAVEDRGRCGQHQADAGLERTRPCRAGRDRLAVAGPTPRCRAAAAGGRSRRRRCRGSAQERADMRRAELDISVTPKKMSCSSRDGGARQVGANRRQNASLAVLGDQLLDEPVGDRSAAPRPATSRIRASTGRTKGWL